MGDRIWAVLVHLGTNLWYEEGNNRAATVDELANQRIWKVGASRTLRFDMACFDRLLARFKDGGVNTIILDLAEGMRYESHPELAIEGSLDRGAIKTLIAKVQGMGMKIIPKLNFSSTHDAWLGEYSRMLSTSVYYSVVRDIINEVAEVFKPEYIHIGMDEEGYECQSKYDYCVIRNNDLWWRDLNFYRECVESAGARAMMWSDYARHHLAEFIEKCPRSIVQCVWYYFDNFSPDAEEMHRVRVAPYKALDDAGFDQLPVGSIEYVEDNLVKLADYCTDVISESHLLGFANTTWASTTEKWEPYVSKAAGINARARALVEGK